MNIKSFFNYRLLNKLYKCKNDIYWLQEILYKSLPLYKNNSLKVEDGSLYYGENLYGVNYIGKISLDKESVIIKDENTLINMKKNDAKIFNEDFIELSKMVYFIFCYLFFSHNAEENYRHRLAIFYKCLTNTKINSFGLTDKLLVDLMESLSNGKLPPKFSELDNYRKNPPILTKFGVVFDKENGEYNLLHYTVKINNYEHISLVLLENYSRKFYKLSQFKSPNVDLNEKNDDNSYFKFDINNFIEYSNISEFIGKFSMLIIKTINTSYTQDVHPTAKDKIIFDMMSY